MTISFEKIVFLSQLIIQEFLYLCAFTIILYYNTTFEIYLYTLFLIESIQYKLKKNTYEFIELYSFIL